MALVTSSQKIQTQFAPLRQLIEHQLDIYLQPVEGCPKRLADAIRYSVMAPGKRLRPMLVMFSAEAVGGEPSDALPAACAVELIHAYSLIHDDLPSMDDDDLRRGLPTCHRKFDEATAILAGDALQALAFEILAHDLPNDRALDCCKILSKAAGRSHLVGGQADDLAAEGRYGELGDEHRSAEHLKRIHIRKTGALIEASVCMGGVATGQGLDHLERLRIYGQAIGLAFQVVDDCLDLESTSEQMGKNTRKDSKLGKLTYPSLMGLEQSRRWAEQLVDQACDAVAPLGSAASNLIDVARFVVERSN
jgi:geranylgeranyl diphosphate synthase, type II